MPLGASGQDETPGGNGARTCWWGRWNIGRARGWGNLLEAFFPAPAGRRGLRTGYTRYPGARGPVLGAPVSRVPSVFAAAPPMKHGGGAAIGTSKSGEGSTTRNPLVRTPSAGPAWDLTRGARRRGRGREASRSAQTGSGAQPFGCAPSVWGRRPHRAPAPAEPPPGARLRTDAPASPATGARTRVPSVATSEAPPPFGGGEARIREVLRLRPLRGLRSG